MTTSHVVGGALAVASLMVGMAAGVRLGQDKQQPVSERIAQTRTLRLHGRTYRYQVTTPGGTVVVGAPPRTVTLREQGKAHTRTRVLREVRTQTRTRVGVVTLPGRTITETLPASTVTLPASTVTETETTTVTETQPATTEAP
jgi:hypothetical protein